MRESRTAIRRLVASLVLIVALVALVIPGANAQTAATPTSEPDELIEPVTTFNIVVGASCSSTDDLTQTICTFTSSNAQSLIVPIGAVCAPVVAINSGSAIDGGYIGDGVVSLVLAGNVVVTGSVSYTVTANGETQQVEGPGVVCTASASAPSIIGTESSVETGADNPSPEPALNQQLDNGEDSTVVADTSSDAIDAVQTGTSADDAPPSPADVTASKSLTDGTEGAFVAAATESDPESGENSEGDFDPITVGIAVYTCATDPGATDPSTSSDCTPAQGVTLSVNQNGVAQPSVYTDASGTAFTSATPGSPLIIAEDQTTIPSGFVPLGNGTAVIDPVVEGAAVTFVNIASAGIGHLQIVSGTCPTAGEARTDYRIIPARSLAAASTVCEPTPGATFTLTSDALASGTLTIVTGSDSSWRGFLPAGTYTVANNSSASDSFLVESNSLTAVIAISYSPIPRGSLVVSRLVCTDGDQEGTTISVGDTVQSTDPDCTPNDSTFRITDANDGTSGPSQDFTLGPDGSASIELTEGNYLLIDLASGQSASLAVSANQTVAANVREIVLTGRAVVRARFCEANVTAPSATTCTQSSGNLAIALHDGEGAVVSTKTTSAGGGVTWSSLQPGSYSLTSDTAFCAVTVDGNDASEGFTIVAGQTTMVNVFICAPPQDETSGSETSNGTGTNENSGGTTTGGGSTNDGTVGGGATNDGAVGGGKIYGGSFATQDPSDTNNTGNSGAANTGATTGDTSASARDSASNAEVIQGITQLPQTGIGSSTASREYLFFGAVLGLFLLIVGGFWQSKRRTFTR